MPKFPGEMSEFLAHHRVSILVSTYKTNMLLAITSKDGELDTTAYPLPRPMGIASHQKQLAIGTASAIIQYTNQKALLQKLSESGDALFLKRSVHFSGDMNIHDMGYASEDGKRGQLWFVNTRFSCLATLDSAYSFVPRWQPKWITTLDGGDRCHLNGLAMVDGKPKYVTSFSETDSELGWKEGPLDQGVLVDIETNEVIASGLSRPHSPKYHQGFVYLLESGTGKLLKIDPVSKKVSTVCQLTGFVRGLSLFGNYAVAGMSQFRQTNSSKLDVNEKTQLPSAVIAIVDLTDGAIAATVKFDEQVKELYDIAVLEGIEHPLFREHDSSTQSAFVVPDDLLLAFSSSWEDNKSNSKPNNGLGL
jgi:uncharacterized protein (TIGR03032 family)